VKTLSLSYLREIILVEIIIELSFYGGDYINRIVVVVVVVVFNTNCFS
jgi:hypothetical protein